MLCCLSCQKAVLVRPKLITTNVARDRLAITIGINWLAAAVDWLTIGTLGGGLDPRAEAEDHCATVVVKGSV